MTNGLTFTTEQITADDIITWGFSVSYAGHDDDGDGRHAYDWNITRDNIVLATSTANGRLHSGCDYNGDNPEPLANMLGTLFSFLSAWAEAMAYSERTGTDSENVDMFDSRLVPLLDYFSCDELALFGYDIKGGPMSLAAQRAHLTLMSP